MRNNNIFVTSLFILFTLFGVVVGIQLNSEPSAEGNDLTSPFIRESEVQEINDLRRTNSEMKNRIIEMEKAIDKYEQERTTESIPLKRLRDEMQKFKFLAGHTAASGPGVIISIEGMLQDNIARVVEEKRYLVNLTNELRIFGAEIISVNNIRLSGRSEITLAGSHINVNATPIAPPYIIQAIGDNKAFRRYVEQQTFIFEFMSKDGLVVDIRYADRIDIPAVTREKPIQFLRTTND